MDSNNNDNDKINGSEYIKFMQDSMPYVEHEYGLKFKKGARREIKTIANYLKQIDKPLTIKQDSWKSFRIFDNENNLIMECQIDDTRYISEKFKETLHEEHERLYKIKDASEIINALKLLGVNIEKYQNPTDKNFSINDWVIEQQKVPHDILKRRLVQIISYCAYKNIKHISRETEPLLVAYLTDYMQMIFRQVLRDHDFKFDYITGLKLRRYLTQTQLVKFEIILNVVLRLLANNELVNHERLKKLAEEYEKIENHMINYINLNLR